MPDHYVSHQGKSKRLCTWINYPNGRICSSHLPWCSCSKESKSVDAWERTNAGDFVIADSVKIQSIVESLTSSKENEWSSIVEKCNW